MPKTPTKKKTAKPKASKAKAVKKKTAKPTKEDQKNWKDPETGQILPGNRFWEVRSSHGRKPIFKSPKQLWSACEEYFNWVESHPLWEAKVFCHQGVVTHAKVPKMQAMTITGLCLFLDISPQTWLNYKEKPDFLEVTREAEDKIYTQKFTGASADLLNANIIARDLGLSDKREVEHGLKVVSHDPMKKPKDSGLGE